MRAKVRVRGGVVQQDDYLHELIEENVSCSYENCITVKVVVNLVFYQNELNS